MRLPLSRLLPLLLLACVPIFGAAAQPAAASLAGYHQLLMPPVVVRFKKSWAAEHRNVKPEEARQLQDDIARLAQEAFRKVLTAGDRFKVVDAAGPGVLELRVTLDDFDLYAPEVNDSAVRRNYVFTAGEATLVAELRDAQAGTVLLTQRDHREMRRYQQLQVANSITNSAEARDLVEDWARTLRRQIDSARPGQKGS